MDLSKFTQKNVRLADVNVGDKTFRFRGALNTKTLENSIKKNGQDCAVVIRELNSGGLQLISGFRRMEALKNIGAQFVLAIVVPEKYMSDDEALRLNFDENVERKSLKTLDLVFACGRLKKKGFSQREIGQMVKKGKTTVQEYLTVAAAPKEMIEKLKSGKITVRAAHDSIIGVKVVGSRPPELNAKVVEKSADKKNWLLPGNIHSKDQHIN